MGFEFGRILSNSNSLKVNTMGEHNLTKTASCAAESLLLNFWNEEEYYVANSLKYSNLSASGVIL